MPTTVFSWVHLSDIHDGHGSKRYQLDQQSVLDRLKKDVAANVKDLGMQPKALFVTGDIANRGKGYDSIGHWLRETAQSVGLEPSAIYPVPGNHDVNRDVDQEDGDVRRLVEALRTGTDELEGTLYKPRELARLEQRMAEYLAFAKGFADVEPGLPLTRARDHAPLYWSKAIPLNKRLTLDLVGLNTALLAANDKDRGHLRVGRAQQRARQPAEPDCRRVVLCLGHHPVFNEWLADESQVRGWLHQHVDVYLSGHVHAASGMVQRRAGGHGLIELTAGALHNEEGDVAGHSFSLGSIVDDGQLALRLYVFKWSKANSDFRLDTEFADRPKQYSEFPLELREANSSSRFARATSFVLDPAAMQAFLDHVDDVALATDFREHIESVLKLTPETSQNEDALIRLRRRFFAEHQLGLEQLSDAAAAVAAITNHFSLSEVFVSSEVGRIFMEARQLTQAARVLAPLGGRLDTLHNDQERHPDVVAKLYDSVGEAHRFSDQFDVACRAFERSLQLHDKNYFASKHLGTVYRIKGDFAEARKYFEQALPSESHHVYFSLGYLYHDCGHYDDARHYYEQCVAALDCARVTDFYRVHVKLAFVHALQRQVALCRSSIGRARDAIKEHGSGDPFCVVSEFAINVLYALEESTPLEARRLIGRSSKYLDDTIDAIPRSVFYCVYWDLKRVFDERSGELKNAATLEGRGLEALPALADKLVCKHAYFQATASLKLLSEFRPTEKSISFYVRVPTSLSSARIRQAVVNFDAVHTDVAGDGWVSYKLTREVLGKELATVLACRPALDTLLDQGAIVVRLKSDGARFGFAEKDWIPFTALVTESIGQGFDGYFKLRETRDNHTLWRVLSKKLLCWDPNKVGRRLFLNPTVGCSVGCEYCYLPQYGVDHKLKEAIRPGLSAAHYRKAIEAEPTFESGNRGTLLSVGSFCDPFLPEAGDATLAILEELRGFGNPIQLSTKLFKQEIAEGIASVFTGSPQLMINVSIDAKQRRSNNVLNRWLAFSKNLRLTVYIKPFMPEMALQLDELARLGVSHPELNFIVGSLYYGELVKISRPTKGYQRDKSLISPVIENPTARGYVCTAEDDFRRELAQRIGRPVFKTSSCSLSSAYGIPDTLKNYNGPFCVDDCPNRSNCSVGA